MKERTWVKVEMGMCRMPHWIEALAGLPEAQVCAWAWFVWGKAGTWGQELFQLGRHRHCHLPQRRAHLTWHTCCFAPLLNKDQCKVCASFHSQNQGSAQLSYAPQWTLHVVPVFGHMHARCPFSLWWLPRYSDWAGYFHSRARCLCLAWKEWPL